MLKILMIQIKENQILFEQHQLLWLNIDTVFNTLYLST